MAAKKKKDDATATAAEKAKEAAKKKQEAEKKKSSNLSCSDVAGYNLYRPHLHSPTNKLLGCPGKNT